MTQNALIKKHLRAGKSINALQALNYFGCFRLSARVNELKSQGLRIDSERIHLLNGKIVAKYKLAR